MNKPLKDWTLGELKEYCDGRRCEECKFDKDKYGCDWDTDPCKWDLSEPPRWTAEDIEDAKAVKRVFKWATQVSRDEININVYSADNDLVRWIDAALFPSLKTGETVTLQGILDAEGKYGTTDI